MKGHKEFKSSIDAVLDKPLIIPIEVKEDYKGEVLKEITLKGLRVGTVIELQPFLIKIPQLDATIMNDDEENLSGGGLFAKEELNFKGEQLKIISENINDVIEIICISFWNKQGDYPNWWPEFFKWNFEINELFVLLRLIISQIHGANFTISIIGVANSMTLIKKGDLMVGLTRCYSSSTV